MWGVVNGGGTGGRARIEGHDVCGKTGTAQVISNKGRVAAERHRDLRDNGWFVFFAPRDNPEIAGVVFLEHGIHGPNAAALAHHILATHFADGRRQAAAGAADARGPAPRLQGPVRAQRQRRAGRRRQLAHVRTAPLFPHRLAAPRSRPAPRRHGAGDDLQHDLRHLPGGGGHPGNRFWVQFYAVGLGVGALIVFLALDYRFLAEHSLFLYAALVGLLLYVLVGGVRAGGSTRWIPSASSISSRQSSAGWCSR